MSDLNIVCLDLEGVLVPEIWIAFSQASGIPELKRTTRDEPATIAKIDPLPGAREFLDELRATTQAVILSDTFTQFAKPLMEKLGWPTLLCNALEVAPDGMISDYKIRIALKLICLPHFLQLVGNCLRTAFYNDTV